MAPVGGGQHHLPGGGLIPGGSHSFKKEVRELNAWYQNELSGLPVEIHTGQAVTVGQLRDMGADVIILAAGSVPVMPKVPGMDDEKCSAVWMRLHILKR